MIFQSNGDFCFLVWLLDLPKWSYGQTNGRFWASWFMLPVLCTDCSSSKWKSSSSWFRPCEDLFGLRKGICSKSLYVVLRVREGGTSCKTVTATIFLSIQVRSQCGFWKWRPFGNWISVPNCCQTWHIVRLAYCGLFREIHGPSMLVTVYEPMATVNLCRRISWSMWVLIGAVQAYALYTRTINLFVMVWMINSPIEWFKIWKSNVRPNGPYQISWAEGAFPRWIQLKT